MPNDGLSQLARTLLAGEWGMRNPRGDQDVTPGGGWDASYWRGDIDPGMEREMPTGPDVPRMPMELDPQPNVDRWLGLLLNQPQRI